MRACSFVLTSKPDVLARSTATPKMPSNVRLAPTGKLLTIRSDPFV